MNDHIFIYIKNKQFKITTRTILINTFINLIKLYAVGLDAKGLKSKQIYAIGHNYVISHYNLKKLNNN